MSAKYVSFIEGLKSALPEISSGSRVVGAFYVTTDTNEIFVSEQNGYNKLSDVVIVEHENQLPLAGTQKSNKIYYVSDTNSLYTVKTDQSGPKWIRSGEDTFAEIDQHGAVALANALYLKNNVGSTTKGTYFNNGVPAEMTYSVEANVPSDAVFTDTTYTQGNGVVITSNNVIKAKLQSENKSSLTAASKGSIDNREYAVGLDANGNLSVNVPWTNSGGGSIEGYLNEANGKFYEDSSYTTEIPGEAGMIYVTLDTNLQYRFETSTGFVQLSESISIGETSSTAYRGDRGKTAYDHASDSSKLTTAKSSGLYKIATTAQGHIASVTAVQKSDITALGIPSENTTYEGMTSSEATTGTSTTNKLISAKVLNDTIVNKGYTKNTGTVTSVSGGAGLTGSVTTTGTIKANLKSETQSALTAIEKGNTANREYAVGLDANGNLSVNVPWNNTSAVTSVNGQTGDVTITAEDVGSIDLDQKGVADGVAELDSNGKVPSSQLPSLLALGETSSTAYRGDRGKTAYDHASDSSKLTTAQASGLYKIATTAQGHIASVTAVAKSDITALGIPSENTTYEGMTSSEATTGTSTTNKLISAKVLNDTITGKGYTKNTGTVTSVATGAGLTGSVTTTGTIKANLKSETKSSLTAASKGTTASREYAVGLDANGNLSVNVPWVNTNPVTSVNGKTGDITITSEDVGSVDLDKLGVADGVATLDSNGKVPTSQLPSFVDDVIEGYLNETNGKFYKDSSYTTEISGESGKIYVTLDKNVTYRWSGSVFIEISASLALGETSSTAYRGDRGKTAYDHASDSSKLTTAKSSGLYKIATTAQGHIASVTAVAKSDITALGIPSENTTYEGMTSSEATTGTSTTNKLISAKVLNDAIVNKGYTKNTGTVTSVATGAGLIGGTITGSGTIKANLKSETKSSLTAAAKGSTASREYAVGLDSNGNLSVNVPWVNTNPVTSVNGKTGDITITSEDVGSVDLDQLGVADGVATLDSNGKVPTSQLPSLLALGETSSTAYRGDRGKTAYDHASDSSKLTTAQASGLYKIATTAQGHIASVTAVAKSDITALGIPSENTTYTGMTSDIAKAGTETTNKLISAKVLNDAIVNKGYTKNTGTVTSVATGAGLTGSVTTTGTIKANLKSETKSSLTAASKGTTASREYAVGLDANGNLSVNVPWVNTNPVTSVNGKTGDITITSEDVGSIDLDQKGVADGVAELDSNGKVPTSQLPSLLALGETSSTAYRGDRGKTAYDHASDSSKLTTAKSSGLYKIATTAQGHIASVTAVAKSDITALGIPSDDTKNTAGSTDTSSKIFLIGATSQAANPQTYSDNQVFTTNGTLTSNKLSTKALIALTGSGTAGADKGSGVSPRYIPTLWTFNAGITVANGEIYLIKIPTAGGTYGVWLSLNNGTNYYPVAVSSGAGRFTTHYAANTVIAVTYESAGTCSCYAKAGADTVATVTGIFRVLNDYDANTTYSVMSTSEGTTGTATTGRIMSAANLKAIIDARGYTKNTGTVTSVATGAGLTGGTITGSGTIKANLKSETKSSLTAAAKGTTASREYAVGLDANGNLSVNVPWVNTNPVTSVNGKTGDITITSEDVGSIDLDQKGVADGVATLDSNGKVTSSQLPSLLALGETSSTAYRGDRGKTAYDHASDSSKLTTAKSSGLYKIATTAQGHIASVTAVAKSDITALGIPSENTTYTGMTSDIAKAGTETTNKLISAKVLNDAIVNKGYTKNTGTVTSVATGAGLTGGTITGSGTLKANLKSETKSSLTAASKGSTASREYAVGLDANGNLSVNVPWVNTNPVTSVNGKTGDITITSEDVGSIDLDQKGVANGVATLDSNGKLKTAEMPTSGVTAGTAGSTTAQTPGFGGTFNVPYITVDTYGRTTAKGTATVKIPNTAASSSSAGLMSAAHYTKVNNLPVFSSAVNAAVGATSVTISNSSITTNSLIEPQCSTSSGEPVIWSKMTATAGQVVITFANALTEAASIRVRITNSF